MQEFERPQPTGLLPATRELIATVENQTGLPIEIRQDPNLKSKGRAMYEVSDPDTSRHLVLVDQDEKRHLDHLVAHEIGHILQFSEMPADKRKLPVVTRNNFVTAASGVASDLARLSQQGFNKDSLNEAVRLWATGLVSQLSDTPTDIAIENGIRNNEALCLSQRNSLADNALVLARSMRAEVKAFTPPRVFLASNAMNYALTKSNVSFLKESWMLRPYRNTEVSRLGDELLELMDEIDPYNLEGYQKVTDTWAERLGFDGWYHWQEIDKIRKGDYSNDK